MEDAGVFEQTASIIADVPVVMLERSSEQYRSQLWAPGSYVAEHCIADNDRLTYRRHRVRGTDSPWVDSPYENLHGNIVLELTASQGEQDEYTVFLKESDIPDDHAIDDWYSALSQEQDRHRDLIPVPW